MFSLGITRLSKLRSYSSTFDMNAAVESYNGVLSAMHNQSSSTEMVRKTLAALSFYYQFDALNLWQQTGDGASLNCTFVHANYDLGDEIKGSLTDSCTTSRKDAIARVFEQKQPLFFSAHALLPPLTDQLKTALLLPVNADDKAIGVLEIFVRDKYDFNSTVKTFLQNIALQLGDKLYRRQLENEQSIASQIKQSETATRKREDDLNANGRTLTALMAHDIKAPICASRLLLEMLQKGRVGALSEGQRGLVDLIEFNQREVLRLIKEALYSQRFISGENQIPVDLAEVIELCSTDLKQELERKNISLTVKILKEQSIVHGDQLSIKHVLLNILHNAIKFSEDGASIDAILHEGEGNAVVITIKDNGRGMTVEEQARLFKPFCRSDGGQNLSDGDGIGLYLSRLIMLQHGGDIKVSSEPTKGSSFSASFPKPRSLKIAS